jgi:hypothetical protein
VLVGALVVTSGLRNRSLSEVAEGVTGQKAQAATSAPSSAATPSPSGGGGGSSSSSSGLASAGKAWLQGQAKQLGWSAQAWEGVIADESGGSTTAKNPSSGAFGIGQFLGATESEYAKYGATSTQEIPQLNAMEHYIHDRYGSPTKALEHENKYKWY